MTAEGEKLKSSLTSLRGSAVKNGVGRRTCCKITVAETTQIQEIQISACAQTRKNQELKSQWAVVSDE